MESQEFHLRIRVKVVRVKLIALRSARTSGRIHRGLWRSG